MADEPRRYVFEAAWEVVNKVGGIYTVLRTKATVSTKELGDCYCMLGPYNPPNSSNTADFEFEPLEPETIAMRRTLQALREEHRIKAVYGRWLVDGYPKVLLFNIQESEGSNYDVYTEELWRIAQIHVAWWDAEVCNAVSFGYMCSIFLHRYAEFSRAYEGEAVQIVAHFHEWQSGVGVILTRGRKTKAALVFTTHATLVGRHLAAGGVDLYNNIQRFDPTKEAGDRQFYTRYCLERAAVHMAHAFTTVSEITALESEHLLGRRPDVLTPNGLNVIKFTALHEFQNLHARSKERIHDFVRGHFYGHLNFDLDRTIYMFTAGRYEFGNKGGDLFIEALSRLNHRLKASRRHAGRRTQAELDMLDEQLASYTIILVYSALAVTGVLGNLWVMSTVSSQLLVGCTPSSMRHRKTSTMQTSAYIYLLLLSVVDLISFVPVPILVSDILESRWPFGIELCKLNFICEAMNKSLSPLVLTALSIDRYIAVCKPTLLWMRQTRFAVGVLMICCSISMCFIVPVTYEAKLSMMCNAEELVPKCTLDMSPDFDHYHAIVCYLIPLVIIVSVYVAILHKLYVHTRLSSVGRKTSISLSRVLKCSVMVVAFYFICWTPYWVLRTLSSMSPRENMTQECAEPPSKPPPSRPTIKTTTTRTYEDYDEELDGPGTISVLFLYLMHALPYTQSAFNWLFYAFLNRNLRQSSTSRCTGAPRSAAVTSTVADGIHTNSSSVPLWKSIQQVGAQLRSASADTNNLLMKHSPFRSRSRIQSRSSTYLDGAALAADFQPDGTLHADGSGYSASLLEVSAANSQNGHHLSVESVLLPLKSASFENLALPKPAPVVAKNGSVVQKEKPSPDSTAASPSDENSSVEWL